MSTGVFCSLNFVVVGSGVYIIPQSFFSFVMCSLNLRTPHLHILKFYFGEYINHFLLKQNVIH